MGDKSKIEWTDATWNPVTGCTKVSQGCKNCYAERVFPRAYGSKPYIAPNGTTPQEWRRRKFIDVQCHPERLDQPLRWKKPRRIFVNSMSDLFHESVPDEFIMRVFTVMWQPAASKHIFQILTKRPARMRRFLTSNGAATWWGGCSSLWKHIQLGISCEDQQTANERIPLLLQTPAALRFLSLEPLLGPINLGELYR